MAKKPRQPAPVPIHEALVGAVKRCWLDPSGH